MKQLTCLKNIVLLVFGITGISIIGCKDKKAGGETAKSDSLAIREQYAESKVLSAEESLKTIKVEDGFTVKLVAAEPLVSAPVTMTFDDKGRIWVAEMETYMLDTIGTDEEKPTNKIVILSDKNGDGVMDERKVFLDSLVLPRAICLIENGILVAESPNLWFYEIENDKPGKRTLVDAKYAEGGSVEHQPNGLLRGLDNWIYNAKSTKRYRKKDGKWLIEKTHFRGQWGITQDEHGRLFYNTNSENLLGDYFTPGFGIGNAHQQEVKGFNENIVSDNRVYPSRPNTGVNRGYMKGVLDDSLRLVNFTAACSPLIYSGKLFGDEFYGNVFVAEPAANLIKRNLIKDVGNKIEGRQAYNNKEFLSSVDERFRPVSLNEGPDGGLYILDLYRGILQDKVFITSYLKNEIKERKLTQPLTCGRIYKVLPKDSKTGNVNFTKDANELLKLLEHNSGYVRNRAQQMLIDGKYNNISTRLNELLAATDKPLPAIHAMWTLEGTGNLQVNDVLPLLKHADWNIRMQALNVIPSVLNRSNSAAFLSALNEMVDDTLAAPYIGFLANNFKKVNPAGAEQLLLALVKKYPRNTYVTDAVISSLENTEKSFYKKALAINNDTSIYVNKQLQQVIADIAKASVNKNIKQLEKQYPRGVALFERVCQGCHGANGRGVRALGPPLSNSDLVTGNKNRLMAIVLYGLTGPVKVSGKVYKAPEISGEMPAIGQNDAFSDDDLAQIFNFIRRSWSNNAEERIKADEVAEMRKRFKGRQKPFTMEEVNTLK